MTSRADTWELAPSILSRWCNCCTILPEFFACKKMVEPSSLGHFLIKQAASQTVTGYFGAGKLWSNSLRIFFEKPITLPETNRHNTWKWRVGIPFFWDSLFSWANCLLDFRECRILWAERDDFYLSFKDLPPQIPSEKNRITYPLQSPALFLQICLFKPSGKLAA